MGFEYVNLDDIYKRSDIIALHCPLTKENHHMINKESLSKMKDNVVIINTSRGGLVAAEDVIETLKAGRIGGVALDVYEEEEKFFFEDLSDYNGIDDDVLARLLTFNNVIVTSHQAFFTQEAIDNIASTTLSNIDNYMSKGKLSNSVY